MEDLEGPTQVTVAPRDGASELLELPPAFRARFRIGKLLGAGGMGSVYAGVDEAGHPVAIKFLIRAGDAGHLARFLREGRLAAKVSHPNLVRVLDVGEVDGFAYIVMERVDGPTLQTRLARGQPPAGEVARITAELLAGLGACHAHGIVHRDIKPANVLLAGQGLVKVADFGIAKSFGADETQLTRTGQVMGTPLYMSPELARGDVAGIASDIYQVGLVLYEMLAGRLPFTGTSVVELLDAHIEAPPPPLPPETPAHLARAALRALAKSPGDRFASVEDMARALVEPARPNAPKAAPPERVRPARGRELILAAVLVTAVSYFVLMLAAWQHATPRALPTALKMRLVPLGNTAGDAEVTLSGDGRLVNVLARSADRASLRRFDADGGKEVFSGELKPWTSHSVLAPDGSWYATPGNPTMGYRVGTDEAHHITQCDPGARVALAENGRGFALLDGALLRVWFDYGRSLGRQDKVFESVGGRLLLSPDGSVVALVDAPSARKREVHLWKPRLDRSSTYPVTNNGPVGLAFSADGDWCAITITGRIDICTVAGGEQLTTCAYSAEVPPVVRFLADRSVVAFAYDPAEHKLEIQRLDAARRGLAELVPVAAITGVIAPVQAASSDGTTVVPRKADGLFAWRRQPQR